MKLFEGLTNMAVGPATVVVGDAGLTFWVALAGTVIGPGVLAGGEVDLDLVRELLRVILPDMIENSCNCNNLYCKTE